MKNLLDGVEEVRVLRDQANKLFEKLVLVRVKITEHMHLVLDAHFPALMQKLEELLYLRLLHLVKHLIVLEVLHLLDKMLALCIKLDEVF